MILTEERKPLISIEDYSIRATNTSLMLDKNDFEYSAFGLVGEYGELCEKFKKLKRDSDGNIDETIKQAILKELGDICWYANRVCWAFDETPTINIIQDSKRTLQRLVLVQLGNAINEARIILTQPSVDIIRTPGNSLILLSSIDQVFAYIGLIAVRLGSSLDEVLYLNIEKLESRKKNNTLRGSGDNR